MEFWLSLIVREEIKKSSGRFLRVWAKHQWWLKFVEIPLKFTYKNLKETFIFTIFLSYRPGLFSFYTPLEHSKIWVGVGWWSSWSGLGGTVEFGGQGLGAV